MQDGITLIALVVTIVVLIILATVSINAVMGDDGLIKRAEQASQHQANAEAADSDAIDELLYQAGVATGDIITNPYDSDGWAYAWVCDNGTWGEKLETGANLPEGEGIVVAKLYETGKKITPEFYDTEFSEGNEYVMVIEGNGEMGIVMANDMSEGYAWQEETASFATQFTGDFIMAYVSKVIVCDGVTNIGQGAFSCGFSIAEVTISEKVTDIGRNAFMLCVTVKNITIPSSVINIKEDAFGCCDSLTKVIIPGTVKNIEQRAFEECFELQEVVIENGITDIPDSCFHDCYKLAKVTIPKSVTSIGKSAFESTNLTTVDYMGTAEEWKSITIGDYNDLITNATINYFGIEE